MKKIILSAIILFSIQNIRAQNVGFFTENPQNTLHIATPIEGSTITTLLDPANTPNTNTNIVTPTIRIDILNRTNDNTKYESRSFNLATNTIINKNLATAPLDIDKNGEVLIGNHFEDVNKNFNQILSPFNNNDGIVTVNLLNSFEIKSKSVIHLVANLANRNARNNAGSTDLYQFGCGVHRSYFIITNNTTSEETIAGLDEKFLEFYENAKHKRPVSLTPQLFTILEPGNYSVNLVTEFIVEDYSQNKDGSDLQRSRINYNPEVNANPTYTRQGSNFSFNIFPL